MGIDLGRVTPLYRGTYNANTPYELNDIVLHTDGNLYWHTSSTATTGVIPTNTNTWKLAFSGIQIDSTLSTPGMAADAKAVGDILGDLLYKPISISSFTVSPTQAERGSTVSSVTLNYSLNKVPTTLKLDNVDQSLNQSGTIQLTGQSITSDKTYTLAATDSGSPNSAATTSTKTAKISFLNTAYWGTAAAPGTINSAFLLGLSNNKLASAKSSVSSFSVNAGVDNYIWFALPVRLGACNFTVGGFSGGFSSRTTISHTNASGYTEDYYVYKSDNAGLGSVTVGVS